MNGRLWHRSPGALALAGACCAGLAAAACGSSSETATSPTPTKCTLTLTPPQAVQAGGGSASLGVATGAECGWNVASGVNWITTFEPETGQGDAQVGFHVMPNPNASPRQGEVSANGVVVRVNQMGSDCTASFEPAVVTLDAAGGNAVVTVTTAGGCQWTTFPNEPWLSITSAAGSGAGPLRFRVADNPGQAREGSIHVNSRLLAVKQSGRATSPTPSPSPSPSPSPTPSPSPSPTPSPTPTPTPTPCTYSMSPTSQTLDSDKQKGRDIALTTQSGCAWTVTKSGGWITISSKTSGTGSTTIKWEVGRNNSDKNRTGTITAGGKAFTVTQRGKN